MNDILKATVELKLVTAALLAFNDQLEATLYDLRYKNGLCVECGKPVNEDVPGAEYCDSCYGESKAIHGDIFRDLEQDRKIS
jgi:hypothetical protein